MKQNLLKKKCVPCEDKSVKPLSREDAQDYVDESHGWSLDKDAKKISKHTPSKSTRIIRS